jgi:hypothetical protein
MNDTDGYSNLEDKKEDRKPEYVPPRIITYTKDELLEQIGPAMACSPSPCGPG